MQINCSKCFKKFSIKPSRLKDGYKKYCSRSCAHSSTRLGKDVTCHACETTVYKSLKAISGSKSGTFFCTKSCQTIWRNKIYVQEKHANWKGGHSSHRELLLRSDASPTCALCDAADVRILAAHHIDEDRSNNTIENLAWLCHNCHHLIHHHLDEDKKHMAAIV
jgi:hypothetical protein